MCQPGYADSNEATAVEGVLAAARGSIRTDDVRYGAIDALSWRLSLSKAGYFGYVFVPADLVLLEPFADQWLSARVAHLLAGEYDNEIRVPLLKFKARMQDRRLWPQRTAAEPGVPRGSVDPDKAGD